MSSERPHQFGVSRSRRRSLTPWITGCLSAFAFTGLASAQEKAGPQQFGVEPLAADITGDGKVDQFDLDVVVGNLGLDSPTAAEGDVDGDGTVGDEDIAQVAALLGAVGAVREAVWIEPEIGMGMGSTPIPHNKHFSNTWPPTHSLTNSLLKWPPNHFYSVSNAWPTHHEVPLSPIWPPNHDQQRSLWWPPDHTESVSDHWPPSHLASTSTDWPTDHSRFYSNRDEDPDDHLQSISTFWPSLTPSWPNNHYQSVSHTWPADHMIGISLRWPTNHLGSISVTWDPLNEPTEHWPANHDGPTSRTWPVPP